VFDAVFLLPEGAVMGWVVAGLLALLLVSALFVLLLLLGRNRRLAEQRDTARAAVGVLRDELVVARAKQAGDDMAGVVRGRPAGMNPSPYVGQRILRASPAAIPPEGQPLVTDADWDRFDDWYYQQRHGR
jgi:hypothetical protein